MYKLKRFQKYFSVLAAVMAIALIGFLLFGMVNADNREAAIEDNSNRYGSAEDRILKEGVHLEGYAHNFFVHIVNSVIPFAKISYEKYYGDHMPGYITSALKTTATASSFDIRNPRTYLSLVYSAFGQYEPEIEGSEASGGENVMPDITNFEDAPEGAIYFSEEDEYYAENGVPPADDHAEDNITGDTAPSEAVEDTGVADPQQIALEKKAPQILIYHTHTSESYMPANSGNFHTLDEKYNMVSVGNIMTKTLEKQYQYNVIHDKTYHDTRSYADSYINSILTVKEQLSKNKSLKVLLDIHRDAFPDNLAKELIEAKKKEYTVEIEGKKAARIMLVVGKGNPNYEELEKFAVYIKKKMDKLYPGLFLKIERKEKAKYNQYFSNYSMLVEVGCSYNTYEEANYSAQLIGKVIGEVLKDLEK